MAPASSTNTEPAYNVAPTQDGDEITFLRLEQIANRNLPHQSSLARSAQQR